MPLPTAADQVVVQGFLVDENGVGDPGQIVCRPVPLPGQNTTRPLVLDALSHTHIRTLPRATTPVPATGYWAVLALANNDPDLEDYGGRGITLPGEPERVIEVPASAPYATVTTAMAAQVNAGLTTPAVVVGQQVRAIWYHLAGSFVAPPVGPAWLTAEQTIGTIENAVDLHDTDPEAHADIRALIGDGAVTQADLAAVAGAVPEQARDALGAALQAGANVTITPDDVANTITISVSIPALYSDEQAQDAIAALLAAGTHSGISFSYNDATNSLSAVVAAHNHDDTYVSTTDASFSGSFTVNKASVPRQPIGFGTALTGGGMPGTEDKICYAISSQVLGDYTGDTGSNPGFVWGVNLFTVVGPNANDGKGITSFQGALVEAGVQTPAGTTFPYVVGLQAEAAFFGPTAGAHIEQMESLRACAPKKKDGATGGTVGTAYTLFVEQCEPAWVGANAGISLFVQGGTTRLQGRVDVDNTILSYNGALALRGDYSGAGRIDLTQSGIGFFGTSPTAKPTGVPVTAEGIHAALVTLGLIAA